MKALRTTLVAALACGALSLFAGEARAEGIVVAPAALSPKARTDLAAQIAAARAKNPQAFRALASVKGHTPAGYSHLRNPYPSATRELRGLGAAALLPMLEALAFDAPQRGTLTDAEWDALAVGMFEAVGAIGDGRARPVLHAAFEAKGLRPGVLAAAARAIGRLAGDQDLALLVGHAKAGDPLKLHAIEGLGELRRVESAKHLAAMFGTETSPASREAIATAMGTLGSSWAWRAMGPKAQKAGLQAREICAQALAPSYAHSNGSVRAAVGDAMLMIDHPSALDMLRASRPSTGDGAVAVDRLMARIEHQRARAKR